jgi:hypothetical protein
MLSAWAAAAGRAQVGSHHHHRVSMYCVPALLQTVDCAHRELSSTLQDDSTERSQSVRIACGTLAINYKSNMNAPGECLSLSLDKADPSSQDPKIN